MLNNMLLNLKKTPKIFRRMFLTWYAAFVCLFLAVCIGLFGFAAHTANHAAQEKNAARVRSLSEYTSRLFGEFRALSVTIGYNPKLIALSENEAASLDFGRIDSTALFAAQQDLITSLAMNSSISNLTVYFFDKNYVISSEGTSTLDNFYQNTFLMSPSVFSDYLRPIDQDDFLFHAASGKYAGSMLAQNPLYAVSLINRSGVRYGNLFIYLNLRAIQRDIESIIGSAEEYYIFTQDGDLFLSRGILPDKKAVQRLSGIDTFGLASGIQSGIPDGWSFYLRPTPKQTAAQLALYALICVLLWVCASFLCIPAIYALCRRNYSPLKELSDLITKNADGVPAQKKADMDLEALKLAVSSIFNDRALLDRQMSMYKPVLINSLLLELLDGSADADSILKGLESLGTPLPYSWFSCIALRSSSALYTDDLDRHAQLIRRLKDASCRFIAYDHSTCCYVVNAATGAVCHLTTQTLVAQLEEDPHILSIGIGTCMSGGENASASCQQAQTALQYLSTDGKSVSYAALSGISREALPLSFFNILHSQMQNARTTGILDADEQLKALWTHFENEHYIHREDLRRLQQNLFSLLVHIQKEHGLSASEESFRQLQSWNINEPHPYEALKHAWDAVYESLKQNLDLWQSEKRQADAQRFLAYIDEHLLDEDMSLSQLSLVFHVSESTISRRVRALTGDSFLDYVARKRIEHACHLLRKTAMPISDIARETGYVNDITFRRLFKKHTGVTPSEYRQAE